MNIHMCSERAGEKLTTSLVRTWLTRHQWVTWWFQLFAPVSATTPFYDPVSVTVTGDRGSGWNFECLSNLPNNDSGESNGGSKILRDAGPDTGMPKVRGLKRLNQGRVRRSHHRSNPLPTTYGLWSLESVVNTLIPSGVRGKAPSACKFLHFIYARWLLLHIKQIRRFRSNRSWKLCDDLTALDPPFDSSDMIRHPSSLNVIFL